MVRLGLRVCGKVMRASTPWCSLSSYETPPMQNVYDLCAASVFWGKRRARREASQPFFEEVGDRFRPSGGVVTTRGSGDPQPRLLARAGAEVSGGEGIEAAAGQPELFGGLGGRQGVLPEGSQHMPVKRRGV